jgi:hypothetical protein
VTERATTAKIDGLRSQKLSDTAAELLIYTPTRDTAVVRMTLVGPKGGVRSETVQLDRHQRRQAAAVLAGHSDWACWARTVVRAAIADYLESSSGWVVDDAGGGEIADELTPVILRALHYT